MAAETSPEWKRPADVMRLRQRKSFGTELLRTKAAPATPASPRLSARLSLDASEHNQKSMKRKNPFVRPSSQDVSVEGNYDRLELGFGRVGQSLSIPTACPAEVEDLEETEEVKKQKWRQEYFRRALDSNLSFSNSSRPSVGETTNETAVEPTQTSPAVPKASQVPEIAKPANVEIDSSTLAGSRTFPRDWSLQVKARFVSLSSFNWCTALRGVDESRGTNAFVSGTAENFDGGADDDHAARQQEFQRQLMYWVHPNIPWLQTFPRITNSMRQFGSQSNNLIVNEEVTKALYNDWCDSMNSAYLMVRSGLCPYLYVCCHHMTVLFRASGVVRREIHAVLTPTTRGLRAALDSEGIDYSLPIPRQRSLGNDTRQKLSKNLSQHSLSKEVALPGGIGDNEEEGDDDEENAGDDSAASVWLEDLGLDRKRYRSVDPSKVRDRKDVYREIDYRPESTVLVEGTAGTQALLNYLLNCSGCFATTGGQAGLPPTMLAPVAFRGATLQSLKVRLGSVLTQSTAAADSHRESLSSIELSGPILPHCVAGVARLLARTTHGSFVASFGVHEPTAPLNCVIAAEPESLADARSNSSGSLIATNQLVEGAAQYLAHDVTHDGAVRVSAKEALRELVCDHGLFTWTIY